MELAIARIRERVERGGHHIPGVPADGLKDGMYLFEIKINGVRSSSLKGIK